MVTIERDFDEEQNIWDRTEKHVTGDTNRREHEVHASDLLWCLRQSYYKKMYPKKLTISEVLKFYKGKISEYSIGKFVFNEPHYREQEHIVGPNGITAHPDIVSHKDDLVMELKATDKEFGFVDPRDQYYNNFISYATQLMYYMFLSYKKNGKIIVNHSSYDKIIKKLKDYQLHDKDVNPFRVWKIIIEDDHDFEVIEADMNFKKSLLEKAIENKDVGYLPKLETIDPADVSKCPKCPYLEQCATDRDLWSDKNNPIMMEYGPQHLAKTSVNFLYKSMVGRHLIKFGPLGAYYNIKSKPKS